MLRNRILAQPDQQRVPFADLLQVAPRASRGEGNSLKVVLNVQMDERTLADQFKQLAKGGTMVFATAGDGVDERGQPKYKYFAGVLLLENQLTDAERAIIAPEGVQFLNRKPADQRWVLKFSPRTNHLPLVENMVAEQIMAAESLRPISVVHVGVAMAQMLRECALEEPAAAGVPQARFDELLRQLADKQMECDQLRIRPPAPAALGRGRMQVPQAQYEWSLPSTWPPEVNVAIHGNDNLTRLGVNETSPDMVRRMAHAFRQACALSEDGLHPSNSEAYGSLLNSLFNEVRSQVFNKAGVPAEAINKIMAPSMFSPDDEVGIKLNAALQTANVRTHSRGRPRSRGRGSGSGEVYCHACWEKGHIAPNCTNKAAKEKYEAASQNRKSPGFRPRGGRKW
jgi:hypothetical protein